MPEFYLVPKNLARKAPRLAKAIHWLEASVFRSLFWVIQRVSLEPALKVSGALFAAVGPHTSKAKKAHENLAIAFPEKSEEWRRQTVRKIFRSLGYSAVELIKLNQIWEERESRIEYVAEPGARELLQSRTGSILITAHVGPWQVGPLMAREYGVTMNTIYAPESNPVMNDLMAELRESIGGRLISSEQGPRPIMKELKAGNSVIMAMDTRPDTGKLIPFFDRDALTNTSAVGLALRTNSQLLVARSERLPGARYRITAYTPIVNPLPDAPVKEQAVAITKIIHRYFEDWIRENPDQWICLKRRWPKAHKL